MKYLIYINDLYSASNLFKLMFADDKKPDDHNEKLIYELERIHTNHINPDHRSYKLLGIHLDELLTFDYHIKHLCSKLDKSLYCINRTKNFLSSKALKTLYYSLVHSFTHTSHIVHQY